MGQQQLLLLVLGIVIVGLAVVVGIQAFGENQKKANADAITNDVIRIASDAQAWTLKPQAFGGGNGEFTGIEFQKLGYEAEGNGAGAVYSNLNANPDTGGDGSGFTLSGVGAETVTITGCNAETGNQVVATVTGTSSDEISTVQSNVDGC